MLAQPHLHDDAYDRGGQLADWVEDAAFLAMLAVGAVIVAMILLLIAVL